MGKRLPLIAVLCAGLLPAGCGGDDKPAGESRPKANGSGYTYEVPPGWKDRSEAAAGEEDLQIIGFRPDTLAVGPPKEGFAPNLNVIRASSISRGVGIDEFAQGEVEILRNPERLGAEAKKQLGEFRPRELSSVRPLELGGDEARSIDYTAEREGRVLRFRLVLALHGGAGYSLTFTSLRDRFDQDVRALSTVTRSWRWDG